MGRVDVWSFPAMDWLPFIMEGRILDGWGKWGGSRGEIMLDVQGAAGVERQGAVRVAQGGADLPVAECGLHFANVGPALQAMNGVGVAKRLGADGLEDAGTSGTVAHEALDPARGERSASAAAGQDRGAGRALLVGGAYEGQEDFGQPDGSWTELEIAGGADGHFFRVEVLPAKAAELADGEAASVEQFDEQAVAQARCGIEQGAGFVGTEDLGQLVWAAGSGATSE